MYCLRMGNDIPLTKGHTRLLETDCLLITLESPQFIDGSVNKTYFTGKGLKRFLDKLVKEQIITSVNSEKAKEYFKEN